MAKKKSSNAAKGTTFSTPPPSKNRSRGTRSSNRRSTPDSSSVFSSNSTSSTPTRYYAESPSQGSSPRSSGIMSVGEDFLPSVQSNVKVEDQTVDLLIKLQQDNIVSAPNVYAITELTKQGETTKDKIHVFDSLLIILAFSHSHDWGSIYDPGKQPSLSKRGHGIFVTLRSYQPAMAELIGATIARLHSLHGPSEIRTRGLLLSKQRCLDKNGQDIKLFLQFPLEPGTGKQILCCNEELQSSHIASDDKLSITALPTKKTCSVIDTQLGSANNTYFAHVYSLMVVGTKRPIKQVKMKKKEELDMDDVMRAVNNADATAGTYSDGEEDHNESASDMDTCELF